MLKSGKLLAIEGVEGAGKSTAVNVVLEVLQHHQIEVITTREPGGTAIGEALRAILKNPDYQGVLDPKTELLLIYAARVQLVEEVIKPALNRGCWVIADRFELSTLAYQGGGRDIDASIINALSSFCLQGLKPDLTIFMDIHPELGMERVKLRGKQDRFEKEALDFFMKVYESYLFHIENYENVAKVDASSSIDQVKIAIQTVLNQFLALNEYA